MTERKCWIRIALSLLMIVIGAIAGHHGFSAGGALISVCVFTGAMASTRLGQLRKARKMVA